MTKPRYYVKGTRIHDRQNPSCYITTDVACKILNKQHQLLLECEKEFIKYDGRKLITLDYIIFAGILGELTEVLDPK